MDSEIWKLDADNADVILQDPNQMLVMPILVSVNAILEWLDWHATNVFHSITDFLNLRLDATVVAAIPKDLQKLCAIKVTVNANVYQEWQVANAISANSDIGTSIREQVAKSATVIQWARMTMTAMTSVVNADVKLELEGCLVRNALPDIGDFRQEDAQVSVKWTWFSWDNRHFQHTFLF